MPEHGTRIISMEDVRSTLSRGRRLCSECLPLDVGEIDGKKYWIVCFAGLPASNAPSDAHTFVPRDLPKHRRYFIPDDAESRDYFKRVDGQRADPTVFHATREMIFVRLDIAKFTQFPLELQPRVIAELHDTVHAQLANPRVWSDEKAKLPERVLHTGDGFILAYAMPTGDPNPWPLQVAQRIAHVLDAENDSRVAIHFRMSVTCGPVYVTGDLAGVVNFIGNPITETERLLQCLPSTLDDVVCFSDSVYRKYRDRLRGMKFFRHGSATDKHGQMHRLYLLEYTD